MGENEKGRAARDTPKHVLGSHSRRTDRPLLAQDNQKEETAEKARMQKRLHKANARVDVGGEREREIGARKRHRLGWAVLTRRSAG